jgi:hypothetical protein
MRDIYNGLKSYQLDIYFAILIRMSMIYSLVARENVVLTDYTSFSGNFSQVAL